jgi:hypothetical protein
MRLYYTALLISRAVFSGLVGGEREGGSESVRRFCGPAHSDPPLSTGSVVLPVIAGQETNGYFPPLPLGEDG